MESIEGRTNWDRINSWWEIHHKRGVTIRAIVLRGDLFDGILKEVYGRDVGGEIGRAAIMTSRFVVLREEEE